MIMVWDPNPDPVPALCCVIPIPHAPIPVEPWTRMTCSTHLQPWPCAMLFHFFEKLLFLVFTWLPLTHRRVCRLNITFSGNPSNLFYTGPLLCIFTVLYTCPLRIGRDCNYLHDFYLTPTTALSQKLHGEGIISVSSISVNSPLSFLCILHKVGIY